MIRRMKRMMRARLEDLTYLNMTSKLKNVPTCSKFHETTLEYLCTRNDERSEGGN